MGAVDELDLGFVADAVLDDVHADRVALWVSDERGVLHLVRTRGLTPTPGFSELDPLGDAEALHRCLGDPIVIVRTPADPELRPVAALAAVTDIGRRACQESLDAAAFALHTPALLQEARARAALVDGVLEAISDQAAVLDREGVVIQANSAWEQAPAGHRAVMDRSPLGTIYPQALRTQVSHSALLAADGIDAVLSGSLPSFQADYDTGERSYSLQVDPLPRGGAVVRHEDISFRKHLQRQLAHRATHDPLTGLPNRMVITERLGQALVRAARTRSGIALLFCDVDLFKQINDSHGHAVGDQVLAAIGHRLQRAVRQSDVVARFGGDEFVVLLEDVEDEPTARECAERLQAAATPAIVVEGRPLHFGVSIGISLHSGDLTPDEGTVNVLLADADAAMYSAKRAGRGSIQIFHGTGHDRNDIETALTRAAGDDGISVVVQPIVDLASGDIQCHEALLRLDLPDFGTLSPADFLQSAEESGAIVEIGHSVLARALAFVAHQPGQTHVSVNVSWAELSQPDYAESVLAAVAAANVDPSRLEVEVLLPGSTQLSALSHLRALREAGVGIVLDAFGRQPVELGILPGMAVSGIKVDRALTGLAASSERHARLVRGIVRLADHLGIACTAEGIETAEQAEVITSLGFGRGQGFFFGLPVPALC